MPELGRYARQLRALLWKPSVQQEVQDEISAHIEQLEQDLIAKGINPVAARAEATRRFGNVERLAAECRTLGEERDVVRRRANMWHDLHADVRYALRQLIASPRFALIAIATLSIGLGASTTIFSIANAVLLRPLPFTEADRLILPVEVNPGGDRFSVSQANFLDIQARTKTLSSIAAFEVRRGSITSDGLPEQVEWTRTSQSLFPTLGVAPLLGRNFTVAEDREGGDTLVAVLSYELWQRRFGGDPAVLDRPMVLDGVSHRIIGVLPRGKAFPENTLVWTPLSASTEYPRGDHNLDAVARLRDGVSIQQAERDLQSIAASLSEAYPESNLGWGAAAIPFSEAFVSPSLHQRVVVLLIAVGLLLLMACVNVANLLLSRAVVREREIAVRAALGAGRGRIARQLLTESLVLSLAGTIVGIVLAAAAMPVIRRTGSEIISRLAGLTLDWTIVGFAVAACVATGLLFGVGPVWRLRDRKRSSGDVLHAVLRSGTRVADGGRARTLLIGASVALAMIMLTGAALVGSSFLRLMQSDLGFSDDNVLIANITFPLDRYNGLRRVQFVREAQRRLSALPGVEMVGASNIPPFGIGNTGQSFAPAERANERQEGYRQGSWRAITPGYFATLGINLKRGRDFSDDDEGARERVVIINETLANMTYPGEDPIGRQLASSNGQVRRIVGVVGDTRDLAIDSVPGPRMYWPNNQFAWPTMWLAVRSPTDHAVLAKAVRAEIASMDPLMPVASMRPLRELSRNASAEQRLTMLVFGIFAAAALTLVSVGLYGLVSYTVTQRQREIGVTLALGARPEQVVRKIVGDGAKLTLVGVGVGAVLSYLLSGALRSILYETDPTNLLTFLAVSVLLLTVGIVASALPARRASRLSPVVAMQGD